MHIVSVVLLILGGASAFAPAGRIGGRFQQFARGVAISPEVGASETARMTEHLIGEELVSNDAEASALADRCIAEAERLFVSEAEG